MPFRLSRAGINDRARLRRALPFEQLKYKQENSSIDCSLPPKVTEDTPLLFRC